MQWTPASTPSCHPLVPKLPKCRNAETFASTSFTKVWLSKFRRLLSCSSFNAGTNQVLICYTIGSRRERTSKRPQNKLHPCLIAIGTRTTSYHVSPHFFITFLTYNNTYSDLGPLTNKCRNEGCLVKTTQQQHCRVHHLMQHDRGKSATKEKRSDWRLVSNNSCRRS